MSFLYSYFPSSSSVFLLGLGLSYLFDHFHASFVPFLCATLCNNSIQNAFFGTIPPHSCLKPPNVSHSSSSSICIRICFKHVLYGVLSFHFFFLRIFQIPRISANSPSVKQTMILSPPAPLMHPTPSNSPPNPSSTFKTACFAHFSLLVGTER